jgi:hypothetical protein
MIISELNHLETISEETRVLGGIFNFSFSKIYQQPIKQISRYQTKTEDDDDEKIYAEASDDEGLKKAFSVTALDSSFAIAIAVGQKEAFAFTSSDGNKVTSYSYSRS